MRRPVLDAARARISGGQDTNLRLAVVVVLGAVVFSVLGLRLWALTIVKGEQYAELAAANQIRQVPLEAPRGAIVDRAGRPLVTNRAARQVVLNVNDVPEESRDDLLERLSTILDMPVARIEERIESSTEPLRAIVLVDDLQDLDTLLYLEEHRFELPGVSIRQGFRRNYVEGSVGAHILGQVSEVSPEQLEGEYRTLRPGDTVGQSGLERRYDEYLRGQNGFQAVEVDATGVPRGVGRGVPPVPGQNLRLSIDLDLQRATERALVDGIQHARRASRAGRQATAAAAVAIDPRDGSVLALASYPTYDPNVFVTSGNDREIQRLLSDERTPLSNRAIGGLYPPGSVYKPVTAVAAMEEGHLKPDGMIACPASMDIFGTTFNNWFDLSQGLMDVREAMSQSCNTFFYSLALDFYRSPGTPLQKWSRAFGLGGPTGIDLPGETAGLVPTPDWRRDSFDGELAIWTPGHTVNLSIGQGDLLVTPLQMTNVYAAIANGGTFHEPRVAHRVEDAGGRPILELPRGEERRLRVPDRYWRPVRDGIYRASNSGTGTATAIFSGFPVEVSGKTGTAEKPPLGVMAWFCAYGPAQEPTIAACVIVERGGHGGTAAAPIVLRMFREHFGVDGGNDAPPGGGE